MKTECQDGTFHFVSAENTIRIKTWLINIAAVMKFETFFDERLKFSVLVYYERPKKSRLLTRYDQNSDSFAFDYMPYHSRNKMYWWN